MLFALLGAFVSSAQLSWPTVLMAIAVPARYGWTLLASTGGGWIAAAAEAV